ncbi:MAG: dihydroorotase [Chloroflexota bacterium]
MGISHATLLIRHARIVDPAQGIDRHGDVLVQEGTLVSLESHTDGCEGVPQLDAKGCILCPAFVDLHCHLREPGQEHKESISTGTRAAAAGGFCAVCCMPNTDPPLDTADIVRSFKQKLRREACIQVLPVGAVSRRRAGQELVDMEGLAAEGVVGLSDDGDPVATASLMRDALYRSILFGLPIIDHCEDRSLVRDTFVNEGDVSLRLGVRGNPSAAEEIVLARDLLLARATQGRLHVAHVSTAGAVDMLRRARNAGLAVTAEATPHHLLLTEDAVLQPESRAFDTNAKVNPPLRTEADRQSLLQALREGTINVIATDHAPHAGFDKSRDPASAAAGISEFETAFGCLLGLVHSKQLSLATLISRLTCDPARLLGRQADLGTLRPGRAANLTLFDPEQGWTVDCRNFLSKGRNSPFDGWQLRGKVMLTVADGNVAYCDKRLATAMPGDTLQSCQERRS